MYNTTLVFGTLLKSIRKFAKKQPRATMADSKLELIVTVDADKANASIKSVNAGLSSLETTAVSPARGAGLDLLRGEVQVV